MRNASLRDLKGIADSEAMVGLFEQRLREHEHCVVALVDNRPAAYEWFCDKPVHLEERYGYKLRMPPDTLYAYDAFVRPEYRRLGIWTLFHVVYLRYLMLLLKKSKIVVMIDHENTISLQAHSKFGYKMVAKLLVFKIFGKAYCITRQAKKNDGHPEEPRGRAKTTEIANGALPSYQTQGAFK